MFLFVGLCGWLLREYCCVEKKIFINPKKKRIFAIYK